MKEKIKKKNTKGAKNTISPEARAVHNGYKEDMKQYVDTVAKSLSKTLSEDFQRERKALSKDAERHMSAWSEDFQSKVSMLAEQVIGMNDKIDGVETRLNDKIDGVIHIQETHTEMIGAMMEDVSEIKADLKTKAGKTEVARLERRVLALEG